MVPTLVPVPVIIKVSLELAAATTRNNRYPNSSGSENNGLISQVDSSIGHLSKILNLRYRVLYTSLWMQYKNTGKGIIEDIKKLIIISSTATYEDIGQVNRNIRFYLDVLMRIDISISIPYFCNKKTPLFRCKKRGIMSANQLFSSRNGYPDGIYSMAFHYLRVYYHDLRWKSYYTNGMRRSSLSAYYRKRDEDMILCLLKLNSPNNKSRKSKDHVQRD